MIAYRHAGISLPRTTYEMLASPKLERIPRADARWGDLAFYGTGHVELYMGPANWTFGAHDTGTRIGRIVFGPAWHPTMYFRVR
jgi:cell wall-associated NlpC family hydrolase